MQKLKGMKDWFGYDAKLLQIVRNKLTNLLTNFNYSYVEFPIMEEIELFKRSSGEESDIVNKEMYEFNSKSGKKIALRPEGTAPFIRMFEENKLINIDRFNKYWYFGSMFRYEQPQKGRYRQFIQAGIENISNIDAYTDAETITLANNFLKSLKINEYDLLINNIGTIKERETYAKELKKYLEKYKDKLEKESLSRLEKNVLRILDDKNEQVKDFIKNCPKIDKYLSKESREYFEKIKTILTKNNISFRVDFNLVRGLDYYENLVFEFVSTSKSLGAQSTILAGGRYKNFLNTKTFESAIGWAAGIERLIEILKFNNYPIDDQLDNLVFILNEDEIDEAYIIANQLRKTEKCEVINKVIKINKMFKMASAIKPKNIIFKELQNGIKTWIQKDQENGKINKICWKNKEK
ncbi:histidyl-tRNA synthetase [Mycoplasmopsis californica]|uniref:Histidine--tRNA ligase n=1 Tax=Mycoplasmopsis equigenitalium TaxID=114883 RepID=A0ABY5J1G3_9BACT|nr:histidine--tRNA ligase [Mycoplasmopsis equigenitalium]UUD37054.1 histidine--tRNA ligase [Mycoplasmopsis equigenitalium]VEU69646.1 histidyl-tRNA synthetase [Mycoplasmopsis californica]